MINNPLPCNGGALKIKKMDTIITYRNIKYPCKLVKRMQIKGLQTNIKGSIYISRSLGIAFLVNEYNTIIEYLHISTLTIDALLDDEDKHHDEEVKDLCEEFAKYIYEETLDEVTIE